MATILWIDVEDLFEYRQTNSRPSGIQRVAFEICRTFHTRYGHSGLVRFIRHDPLRNSFREIGWSELTELSASLANVTSTQEVVNQLGIQPYSTSRHLVRKLVHRLPTAIRIAVIAAFRAQGRANHEWMRLLRAIVDLVVTPTQRKGRRRAEVPPNGHIGLNETRRHFRDCVTPGDVLLVLGAPWSHPDYASLIEAHRKRYGIRFALLVHDIIPLRRPEWCDRNLVRLFRSWFKNLLPICDHVFAVSLATAADVEAYAHEQGIVLPTSVVQIPIGSGFGDPTPTTEGPSANRLPLPGSYALVVSTIEVRKNHLLLFHVWRRLLDELPIDRVPTLVFAGRVGWLVDDLMQQISNTDYLNGKLLIINNSTDEELAALYRGCLFTLLASFYEGWGLPVTESLTFGKPCFASNRTSLPEAGGELAKYFDPDNLHDAYNMIRGVIEDESVLLRWSTKIQQEFRLVPWTATVESLLSGLGDPLPS